MAGVHSMLVGAGGRLKVDIVITGTVTDYVLNTAKVTGGYAPGGTDVTLTISGGAVVGGTSASTAALTVDSSWHPADNVTIVNNGAVVGRAGTGGAPNGAAGTNGGPALAVSRAVTITNNGVIGGGGGGGGAGGGQYAVGGIAIKGSTIYVYAYASGGGGGGGAGYASSGGMGNGNTYGSSPSGTTYYVTVNTPGAAGSAGTPTAAGGAAGGAGGVAQAYVNVGPTYATAYGYGGAQGGNLGSNGSPASNGNWYAATAAGAAGNCTTAGSNANIVWAVAGNRYGTLG